MNSKLHRKLIGHLTICRLILSTKFRNSSKKANMDNEEVVPFSSKKIFL